MRLKQRLNKGITKLIQDGVLIVVPDNDNNDSVDSGSLTIGVLPPNIPPVPPKRSIKNRLKIRPPRYFKMIDAIQGDGMRDKPVKIVLTKKGIMTTARIKNMAYQKRRGK